MKDLTFSALTHFKGDSILLNGKLKTVGISLKAILPPSTADSGEKSVLGDTYSSKTFANKVVPSYNITRRGSFEWKTGQWKTLIVELLQLVIIGIYNFYKVVQDVEKVGYRPLTLQ